MIEKVAIVIVLLSISPGIIVWLRGKPAKKAEPERTYVSSGAGMMK